MPVESENLKNTVRATEATKVEKTPPPKTKKSNDRPIFGGLIVISQGSSGCGSTSNNVRAHYPQETGQDENGNTTYEG